MAPWIVPVFCTVVMLTLVYVTGSHECSVNCLACSADGSCVSCLAGYYGVNCTPCNPHCNNSACLFDLCSEGCVKGLYGYTCDKDCRQCPHGCDQWKGICLDPYTPTTQYYLAGKEHLPLHTSYKIMIGIMSIAGAGILCIICVFVKEKRFRYTTFHTVFRRPRHRRPLRMRRIPRNNSTCETFIWEAAPDNITVLSTDNITSCDITTHSLTSSNHISSTFKSEIIPTDTKSTVRIFISPPSPCKSRVAEQADFPPTYVSLFP